MGRSLSDLFSDAEGAQAMIDALGDATAKAVNQDIKAHKQVWANKTEAERKTAAAQASVWATRQAGHRVECPACNSLALIQGKPAGPVATSVQEDEVVQRQTMSPSSFECVACGLRILGLSKLSAAGLGDAYTAKSSFTAAEFFRLYTEEELEEARNATPEFEEDFNEY